MIDVEKETLLTPNQACKEFPGSISLPTIWRYMSPKGVRGVRLESLVCGGKRWTSREAIARFISAQNAADDPTPPVITAAQRRRQSEAAKAALVEMGVSRLVRPPQSLYGSDDSGHEDGVNPDPTASGNSNSESCSTATERPKRGQIARRQ